MNIHSEIVFAFCVCVPLFSTRQRSRQYSSGRMIFETAYLYNASVMVPSASCSGLPFSSASQQYPLCSSLRPNIYSTSVRFSVVEEGTFHASDTETMEMSFGWPTAGHVYSIWTTKCILVFGCSSTRNRFRPSSSVNLSHPNRFGMTFSENVSYWDW